MKPPTKAQNALAVLDLPGSHLSVAQRWMDGLPSMTIAELMMLAARLERSRSGAGRVRTSVAGALDPEVALIEQRLGVMWAAIEGEIERRCAETGEPK
ncbi:MAG: hypothetical protein ACOCYW_05385 [Roseicyclus sp.]